MPGYDWMKKGTKVRFRQSHEPYRQGQTAYIHRPPLPNGGVEVTRSRFGTIVTSVRPSILEKA